jgi:tRNA-Thr(GGU) m(6)t(6)A37 methyltransferase TsaA
MPCPDITIKPIGIIHTPYKQVSDHIPIQGRLHPGSEGYIELFHDYYVACRDIEGFSHLYLLYHFHLSAEERMVTKPYLDSETRGVFSTKSPHRPNHIGLSLVKLVSVAPGRLTVRDVDMIDGTPLLDIKPYIPRFDAVAAGEKVRTGWMQNIPAGNFERGATRTSSHKEWLQESE